jgi:anti-sigma B factor antagonist
MLAQLTLGCLETELVGDILVVRFTQRALVDDADIRRLGQNLTYLIQELGYRRLVLDLGEVQRMSSVMIGQLLAVTRRAQAARGRLALCQVRPEVAEVFAILHLSEILPSYDTEADALLSFCRVRANNKDPDWC